MLKCLPLDAQYKEFWVEAVYVDGPLRGVHAYGLGSNVKKRQKATKVALGLTEGLRHGPKDSEDTFLNVFNDILLDVLVGLEQLG